MWNKAISCATLYVFMTIQMWNEAIFYVSKHICCVHIISHDRVGQSVWN